MRRADRKKPLIRWILPGIGLALILFPTVAPAGPGTQMYYAKFFMKAVNGMVATSKLEMLPAHDEFRMDTLHRVRTRGTSDPSGATTPQTEAIHDAMINILVQRGVKSVSSHRTLVNGVAEDVIILNYEGVMRLPYRILSQHRDISSGLLVADIEFQFAPLTYPDQWRRRAFFHRIKKGLSPLVDLFKYAFAAAD